MCVRLSHQKRLSRQPIDRGTLKLYNSAFRISQTIESGASREGSPPKMNRISSSCHTISYHRHTLVRALCISFKILCLIACEVRTRAFGDARAATNLQEAQKYFANSYLLGIFPLPLSLSAALPCRKASLALSLLKANTDSACYPTFARDKATSLASPTLCPILFEATRRGEQHPNENSANYDRQITTGLRVFCVQGLRKRSFLRP